MEDTVVVRIESGSGRHLGLNFSTSQPRNEKKPGGKINSPPGLTLGLVTPKELSEPFTKSWALVPLFLRCFFLCCFFLSHRLLPPFQSAIAEKTVKSWE